MLGYTAGTGVANAQQVVQCSKEVFFTNSFRSRPLPAPFLIGASKAKGKEAFKDFLRTGVNHDHFSACIDTKVFNGNPLNALFKKSESLVLEFEYKRGAFGPSIGFRSHFFASSRVG